MIIVCVFVCEYVYLCVCLCVCVYIHSLTPMYIATFSAEVTYGAIFTV